MGCIPFSCAAFTVRQACLLLVFFFPLPLMHFFLKWLLRAPEALLQSYLFILINLSVAGQTGRHNHFSANGNKPNDLGRLANSARECVCVRALH